LRRCKRGKTDFNNYTLEHLIEVARELGLVERARGRSLHGVRDYRNFVHLRAELREKRGVSNDDATIAVRAIIQMVESL